MPKYSRFGWYWARQDIVQWRGWHGGAQRIPGCGSESYVICNLRQALPLCASCSLTLKWAELYSLGFYSPNEIVEVKALCTLVNTMMVVNPIILRAILRFGQCLELTYKTDTQK